MTIEEIYRALESRKRVNWCNASYEVHPVQIPPGLKNPYAAFSRLGDQALRVTCISNGFGSLLCKSDLAACYIEENNL